MMNDVWMFVYVCVLCLLVFLFANGQSLIHNIKSLHKIDLFLLNIYFDHMR